jgi:hypothetical protein
VVTVIDDCYYLACDFPIFHFRNSYQEANVVAYGPDQPWLDSPPDFLVTRLQALKESAWVHKISMDGNFTMEHLTQFVNLWAKL